LEGGRFLAVSGFIIHQSVPALIFYQIVQRVLNSAEYSTLQFPKVFKRVQRGSAQAAGQLVGTVARTWRFAHHAGAS
jgi:hypothetical protein